MNPGGKDGQLMKIALLIDHLGRGGAQRLLADLAAGLDRTRFDPVVISLRSVGDMPRPLREGVVRLIELGGGKYQPAQIFALYRLFRREKPHLVHTHLTAARMAGVPAARLAGVGKIFIHEHSGGQAGFQDKIFRYPLDRWLAARADRILAVSCETARFCLEEKGYPSDKMDVLPNWIDPEPFRPDADRRVMIRARWGIAPDAPVIGSVGRLHAVKGQDFLVRAAPRILAKYPHARIVIVGEGEERESLLRTASRLGVAQALLLPGHAEDVEQVYSAFDLFVLPSLYETSSLVLLEAAAAGCPLIASNVGGIPEIVRHEETGLLVPPRQPRILAESVLRLLGDEVLRSRLKASAGRHLSREFDRERSLRTLEHYYREAQSQGLSAERED